MSPHGSWTIRNVGSETIRAYRMAALARSMTVGQYLAWLAERLPAD